MNPFRWAGLMLAFNLASLTAATRTHDITLEDYFTQSYIDEFAVAPDGSRIAYVESRWGEKSEPRHQDIWIIDTASRQTRRLTFDKTNESHLQWHPDGQRLFFQAAYKEAGAKGPPRDGKTQVWQLTVESGHQIPVTQVKDGIADSQLRENGDALYYLVHQDHVIEEWKTLRQEYKDDVSFGHGVHQVSELWRLDLQTWRSRKVVDEKRFIREFDVTSDGRRIAMITVEDERLINHEGKSRVDVLEVATEKIETLPDERWRAPGQTRSPFGWLEEPRWDDTGNRLAFLIFYDGYPSRLFVADWGTADRGIGEVPNLFEKNDPGKVYFEGGLAWRPDQDALCVRANYQAWHKVYSIRQPGRPGAEVKSLTRRERHIHDYAFSADGQGLITLQGGADYDRDLFLAEPATDNERRLTRVNPQVDTWKLPQRSVIQWAGANGDPVEGILELPPDHRPGEKLPLVVHLHGGPTGSTPKGFRFWIYGQTLFPSRGYALLSPNYRGSTGYGDRFLTDLIGQENDIEVKDILAGVDHLVEQGIADREHMGVMGWSNGGYLSNCLLATGRFKAVSSGAGVFDMSIQWAEEDTPGHVINYMQGLPWKVPEAYLKASPLYSLKPDNRTATLIHVGEHDPRVPASHSRGLHRAMKHYLNAPCELIVYPGAGHGLTLYKHREAKMKWDHAWFDKYVKGNQPKAEKP